MTIRHMNIFLGVCANGFNTTRAAAEMHMTQPAVSLAIRELEQYYGVILFDRIGRRLQITEAGRTMLEYASHIVSLFDGMESRMRGWDAMGTLRVGASITIGSQFLPSYVKEFSRRCPGVEVRVVVEPSDHLERKIQQSELDFALIEGVLHIPVFVYEEYMEDHLTVICPADGRYRSGQEIGIEEFRRQKFLLREVGSGTREVFENAVAAAGFSVTPLWEATSNTALINAVINGLGIAVLPHRMIMRPLDEGLVTDIRVRGLDFCRRFHIVYHREKYLTTAAQTFLDICRSYEFGPALPAHSGE